MVKHKRKSRKVKKSRNKILYLIVGLVSAIFIFTAGIMAMMVSEELEEGPPPKRVEEPHLLVEDVFFMKSDTRADDERIDLTTTVYITNDGLANAHKVKIIAYPLDENKNLASDRCEKEIGIIPMEKTSEADFNINVPAGTKHKVELLIFEDGRLILRGDSSVVIQGTHSSTEKYQTREVKGTKNDQDYDGLPDAWEQYYGLNPSDPTDAYKDNDGDGMTNLQEYYGNTTPKRPAYHDKKKDEEDTAMLGMGSTSFGGLIIFLGILILIIIIIGAVIISNPSKKGLNKNRETRNQSSWLTSDSASGTHQYQPYHPGPWLCPKCGGWVINDTCSRCGNQYSIKPTQSAQSKSSEGENNQTKIQ